MSNAKVLRCIVSATVLLMAGVCLSQTGAQDKFPDHSCTVNAGGGVAWPFGDDGKNFNGGWGLQVGGGFAVTHPVEPRHGAQLFLDANFMYARLNATAQALAAAIALDPSQLGTAKSARGSFYAVTVDPTVRFPISRGFGVYASGGFGWFRRSIGFNGANPANLLHASASSLERLSSDSGVFDLGGGMNFSLTHNGGLMVYTKMRVYHGAAVNSSTTLLPLFAGVRW